MKNFKTILAALLLLCCATLSAHDFEVEGIFYNILSEEDRTVEVTYKGSYGGEYSGEYSGNVVIPANVTYEGTTYSVTTIGGRAFFGCTGLTSIEIPNSVTTIREWAFSYCDGITSIEIPNSVTTIREWAFSYCDGITSIEIPNSVTTIGDFAFNYCTSLTSIEIPYSVTTIGERAFSCCTGLTSIEIPNSVTTIRGWAFSYCNGLTSIEIPNSVTTIGNYAFCGCEGLTSIVVAEDNTIYDSREDCNAIIKTATNTLILGCKNTAIPNSVTTIGEGAFEDCTDLTSIEIPNSVTTIGDYAFCFCTDLTSIEIPNSVTTIGYSAFYECTGLTSIEIPNSVTTIGHSAFKYCTSLTSIEIPNSVTTIGDYAFRNCEGLTSVTIGNSVTTIGVDAFYDCTGLTSITSLIPADKLFIPKADAFYNVPTSCTLYVPAGAKETYAATDGWNEFTNIVEIAAEQFELTVSAANYATLYLDFKAEIPEGVEVYTASNVDGNRLMMQQVTGTLPAKTGVIVRAEQGTYTFVESCEAAEAIESNLLRGSVEDEYITPEKNAKYYVLAMKDGVVGMYEDALSGGTFKNNANKAYLQLKPQLGIYDEEVDTEDPGMQLSNSYYFDFGGTTAIDPVVTECEENVYYDLSGRRVENPTRGIYILNGKKILVK